MLKSVVITTSMPIVQEMYYQGFQNNILNINASQNTSLTSVLTDFLPDLFQGGSGAFVGSAQFIYNATSLWRLFTLLSHDPMYLIDCQILFTDKNNNTWPLGLFTKQSCSLKFMFIKKNLIKNGNLGNIGALKF